MSHEVIWTDELTSAFIEKAMLSEDEAYIIRSRARGYTCVQQSIELNKSVQTIHRMISILKKKYDVVQAKDPETFPKRRTSKVEKFMDEN